MIIGVLIFLLALMISLIRGTPRVTSTNCQGSNNIKLDVSSILFYFCLSPIYCIGDRCADGRKVEGIKWNHRQWILMLATPAKWNVFKVICVPGSPILWAPIAPIAVPASILFKRSRDTQASKNTFKIIDQQEYIEYCWIRNVSIDKCMKTQG